MGGAGQTEQFSCCLSSFLPPPRPLKCQRSPFECFSTLIPFCYLWGCHQISPCAISGRGVLGGGKRAATAAFFFFLKKTPQLSSDATALIAAPQLGTSLRIRLEKSSDVKSRNCEQPVFFPLPRTATRATKRCYPETMEIRVRSVRCVSGYYGAIEGKRRNGGCGAAERVSRQQTNVGRAAETYQTVLKMKETVVVFAPRRRRRPRVVSRVKTSPQRHGEGARGAPTPGLIIKHYSGSPVEPHRLDGSSVRQLGATQVEGLSEPLTSLTHLLYIHLQQKCKTCPPKRKRKSHF